MKYIISNNSTASIKPYMGSGGMFPGLTAGESIIVSKRIMEDAIKRYAFLSYSIQPEVVVEEIEEELASK